MFARLLAMPLLIGVGLAVWHAAPAWDAAEENRRIRNACLESDLYRRSDALRGGGVRPEPAVCTQAPEREHWRTDLLLIAAVLGVGAAVLVALPQRHG